MPTSLGIRVEGVLILDHLPPGRYQLEEVGSHWCHARSDSVEAQGQVVVKAGQWATAWAFNRTTQRRPIEWYPDGWREQRLKAG